MSSVQIKWTGRRELRRNIDGSIKVTQRATRTFTEVWINKVFAETQYLCPIDTGQLRASGSTEVKVYQGTTSASIKYGGRKARYAIYVHEDLSKKHKPPTGAKFIEVPFVAASQGFLDELKFYVKNGLKATIKTNRRP